MNRACDFQHPTSGRQTTSSTRRDVQTPAPPPTPPWPAAHHNLLSSAPLRRSYPDDFQCAARSSPLVVLPVEGAMRRQAERYPLLARPLGGDDVFSTKRLGDHILDRVADISNHLPSLGARRPLSTAPPASACPTPCHDSSCPGDSEREASGE